MNLQQPRWGNVGIIALVPDQWSSVWMDRHHVLTRLASYFHVVWMHQPGWRQCLSAMGRSGVASKGYSAPAGAMQVYEPRLWFPRLGRPSWLGRFTAKSRFKQVYDMMRAQGCRKIVLYLWGVEFADAIDYIPHNLSIYNVSDEYSFSSTEVPVTPKEHRLLSTVGQVFIISPALMEKKGGVNPHTAFVPAGVDYWRYATPMPEPDDLRQIPHPRIGYLGHLKRNLDWPLLLELTGSRPDWSFVFVGPKSPHPEINDALSEMSRRPNVHFLGGRPAERLGEYIQHFDVCTMPYVVDDYTKYIYPGKMHEYLASGKPVVSAPVRSVHEFQDVITIATSAQEWSVAIQGALSERENTQERRMARQKVAHEYDWGRLVEKIANTIAARLDLETPDAAAGVNSAPDSVTTTPLF
jgi:glycosyltransferase involved in cell wall biosynthesis